jgi:Flp pilus assembly protein TadD
VDADINLLDLAADHEGHGAPRALGRRLPAMVAQVLRAAGVEARHASATVELGGEPAPRLGWAVPAGALDDEMAVELSRRMGPARLLAFGQLGPTGKAGELSLSLRVLRRDDAAEVLRLDQEFFEEEVADVAHAVARSLAGQLGKDAVVAALDPAGVLGSRDAAAILSLQEGLDALTAAEGGVAGADPGRAVELLLDALERDSACGAARDLALAALAAHAGAAIPSGRALELASTLADRAGGDHRAPILLARLLRRGREPDRARQVLADALDRAGPTGDAALAADLARVLNELGQHEEAATRCRAALAAAPTLEADLREELGLALARSRGAAGLELARAELERVVELEPGRARAWGNLGRCRHLLGDVGPASEAYERSLALDPGAWETARNHAELLVSQGDLAHAESRLRLWASLRPDDPQPALSLGELLASSPGREAEATDTLAVALERHPDDPRLHALLGGIFTQTGTLDAAERHYREALRLDPRDPALMSNLAVVLSQRGELREAEELASQAVDADPSDPISRKVLDHIRKLN